LVLHGWALVAAAMNLGWLMSHATHGAVQQQEVGSLNVLGWPDMSCNSVPHTYTLVLHGCYHVAAVMNLGWLMFNDTHGAVQQQEVGSLCHTLTHWCCMCGPWWQLP
jgi:hypothetical protein